MQMEKHKCKDLVYDEEYINKEKCKKAVFVFEHCFFKKKVVFIA